MITRMEHGSFTAVAVRLLLLEADGVLEPHGGSVPEPFIHRRGFGLARGPWGQGRLIFQDALEGSPVEE